MSGYKSFAVAGLGNFGTFLATEFIKLRSAGTIDSVSILTRLDSKSTVPDGARAVPVDYADTAALTAALRGIDVVISALGGAALLVQIQLAEAAKAAGVKLFVPSEFGNPTEGISASEGPIGQKVQVQEALKKIGLPYALFWTGPFSDFIFIPPLGWDLAAGKVTIAGDGKAPISFTTRTDIAHFVGHVLTTLPAERLANSIFRIEGDRASWNDVIEGYQTKSGKTLNVTYRPRAELEASLKANPADFLSYLQLKWDLGKGIVGKPEELANGLLPGWRPKKVLDVLV